MNCEKCKEINKNRKKLSNFITLIIGWAIGCCAIVFATINFYSNPILAYITMLSGIYTIASYTESIKNKV